MAVHQRKHSDDDAECSKSYFQRGRVSIALRCSQLVLAVGTSMNNAGKTLTNMMKKKYMTPRSFSVTLSSQHMLALSSIGVGEGTADQWSDRRGGWNCDDWWSGNNAGDAEE